MLGFGVIITLMIISNAFVLFQLNEISNSAKITLSNNVTGIEILKHLKTILINEERNAQKFTIAHDRTYYDLFLDGGREFDFYIDSLMFVQRGTDATEQIHQIRRTHTWFIDGVVDESRKSFSANYEPRDYFLETISDSLSSIHTMFDQLIRHHQNAINTAMITVETKTANSLWLAFLLTLSTLALAIILSIFIARTITHPIEQLIDGTEKIAGGSFESIHVSSGDEIALLSQAVNEMSGKLKQINEYKAEMMQQISHEIRSPLQMIMWVYHYLTSQEAGPLNDEQLKMLESIRNTVDRVANFSDQYLDLAKSEAGMMQYNFEGADIIELVKKVMNEMEFSAASKNITIELDTVPSPEVTIDVDKMYLVISNLLSNAVKYTPKNGKIHVQAKPSDTCVKISVSDTGIGISAEDLPHIFTKFYRAGNVSRHGEKGTGVGLALVKALTEGHGGKIFAESTLNVGSTFTLELPFPKENIQPGSAKLKAREEKTA